MDVVDAGPFALPDLGIFGAVATAVYKDDLVWARASETGFAAHWAAECEHPTGIFRPLVALKDGLPVARAVAIAKHGATGAESHPQGYVGYFECVTNHREAAALILARCEQILRQQGVTSIQAPKADNQLFGCQVDGFDLPHLCLTPHNPPSYRALFEAAGYVAKQHICTFRFARDAPLAEYDRHPAQSNGAHTRSFDPLRLEDEIVVFHQLQARIFADRQGYVPRTLDEDRALIMRLLPMIDPDLIIVAEDRSGRAIGILVCIPDFYQALAGHTVDRARVITIGVLPGHSRQGIGTLMGAHLRTNILANDRIAYVEASLVLAQNFAPQNLAQHFGAQPGRQFVVLEKPIWG
jgi:GNAT superfamily N-acetyltransferase